MRARIRGARQTTDAAGFRFLINARTDVFFQRPAEQHNDAAIIEAMARARACGEAGADGIFAPVGDAPPQADALAQHGVARGSHGPRPYRLAMKALEEAAREPE
jgi:methylisocitrate lyase